MPTYTCKTCNGDYTTDTTAELCTECEAAAALIATWPETRSAFEWRESNDEAPSHIGMDADDSEPLCGADSKKFGKGFPADGYLCAECVQRARDIIGASGDEAKVAAKKPKKEKKSKKKGDTLEAGANGEPDPLLEDARKALEGAEKRTASHLQRVLGIGYNRAADLLEALKSPLANLEASLEPGDTLTKPTGESITVTAEAKTDTIKKKVECKVQLNDHDKAVYGLELAKLNIEYGKVDRARASAAKEFKEELDGLDQEINRVSGKLQDGYEQRGMDCEIQFNVPKAGMKTITRLDTSAQWTESMKPDELQPRLDFGDGEKAKGKGGKADDAVVTSIDGQAAYICGCGESFAPDAPGAYVVQGEASKCPECFLKAAGMAGDLLTLSRAGITLIPPPGMTAEDEVSPFATHCNEQ